MSVLRHKVQNFLLFIQQLAKLYLRVKLKQQRNMACGDFNQPFVLMLDSPPAQRSGCTYARKLVAVIRAFFPTPLPSFPVLLLGAGPRPRTV